ncbi:MAG: LacI family DNA-binding transcriptional regulator [Trueperaceae bacterium]|nr:LacI family DNA-binding transcriptional regulator [Trueperaceae bacterium]
MDTQRPKNITIFDVAQASGVSYSTVSRVLNGFTFVKESTRLKVLEAAEELGYVANMQARSLAGGKSKVIGLLVPQLDNGYINEICRGIDQALVKVGYDLMLYTTHHEKDKEAKYVKAITNGLTDGLLLLVPLVPAAYIAMLREQNYPYVLIDQGDNAGESYIVDSTNWQGAYDATKHLLELGHSRIAFVSGIPELSSSRDRLEGFKAALQEYDVPFDSSLIAEGFFEAELAIEATTYLLSLNPRPSAIFASNDLSALGAMEAVRQAKLRIPEDISIIGFDDIPQASITYPKLTTIRQPLEQMGRVAVKLLLEQIEKPDLKPRRVTLATQLVVRDSVKQIA